MRQRKKKTKLQSKRWLQWKGIRDCGKRRNSERIKRWKETWTCIKEMRKNERRTGK